MLKKILFLFALVILSGIILNPVFAQNPDTDGDGIPDSLDSCPTNPETVNGFQDTDGCPDVVPPPTDTDGDGIPNSIDICVTQPETLNGYQDTDGCPDTNPATTDTDGDGISDSIDQCPTQPETVNGFADLDGCPDVVPPTDTDGDGISDSLDQCPTQKETVNGYQDTDGCSDTNPAPKDTDNDGILDSLDSCPTDPEIVNGFQDSDGCPDIIPPPITQENLPSASVGNRDASLFIKINPSVLNKNSAEDKYLKMNLIDVNTGKTIPHTSFFVTVDKDGKLLMRDLFHTHSGDLKIKIQSEDLGVNDVIVYGDEEPYQGGWTATNDQITVKAPILLDAGLYHFEIKIFGIDDDSNVFIPSNAPKFDSWLSVGEETDTPTDTDVSGPEDCASDQIWQNNQCTDVPISPKNDLNLQTAKVLYRQGDMVIISGKVNLQNVQNPTQQLVIENPRLVNAFGSKISDQINVNQQVQIVADVKNNQEKSQKFVYVVQVKNQNGVIVSLGWLNGSLNPGQTFSPALSWTPKIEDVYTAEIFVWDVSEEGSNKSWQRLNSLATPLTLSISSNGHVSQSSNSVYDSNGVHDVAIIVKAPDNNIVAISQVHPNADGSFQTSLKADGPQFKAPGDYAIFADFYGLKSQIIFKFTGGTGACVGCEETDIDTDRDGISDSLDYCPTQAETVNNYQDTDGCPDVVPIPTTDDLPHEITIKAALGSGSSPGCEETSQGCFIPKSVSVAVGGKVIFSNPDTVAHTFTAGTAADGPSGKFDSSLVMAGSSYEWTPTTKGQYDYLCLIHPWMTGILFVGEGTYIPPQPEDNFDLQVIMGNQVYDLSDTATMDLSIGGTNTPQNVALEISDPSGTSIISRSFMVDSQGTSFEFKIDENFKTGTYKVIATTSNNDNTVTDTAYFKVKSQYNSFKITSVQVTDQQGNPSSLQKGEMGFIKVNLEANKSITTLVTVNLFDSDLTSIGIGSIKTTLSSGNSEIILSFMIPNDVSVGQSNIYVNAFSDWPSNGGIPLTSEISITENIE